MTFSEASLKARDLTPTLIGWVIKPGDTSWDQVRRAFNFRKDEHPAEVVDAAAPANIAAAVRYASRRRVRVAVQPLERRYIPAEVLHTSFPHHLPAVGTEAV